MPYSSISTLQWKKENTLPFTHNNECHCEKGLIIPATNDTSSPDNQDYSPVLCQSVTSCDSQHLTGELQIEASSWIRSCDEDMSQSQVRHRLRRDNIHASWITPCTGTWEGMGQHQLWRWPILCSAQNSSQDNQFLKTACPSNMPTSSFLHLSNLEFTINQHRNESGRSSTTATGENGLYNGGSICELVGQPFIAQVWCCGQFWWLVITTAPLRV